MTDLRYGHRALRFIEEPPSQEERDTKQVAMSPTIVICSRGKADTTSPMESNGMPRASLTRFVQFCEAPAQKKEGVVLGRGFDYYGPLIALIRRTHWATGLIDTFRNALPSFLENQNLVTKRENMRLIGEAYSEYWQERALAYFPVGQYTVDVAGLTIRIGPAVGMLNRNGDRQSLWLWFNKRGGPSLLARQIVGCLMDEVKEDPLWYSGVWDIRRKDVPLPAQVSGNFRGELEEQATMYLAYIK